jgi:hypothetical protein
MKKQFSLTARVKKQRPKLSDEATRRTDCNRDRPPPFAKGHITHQTS